MNKLFLLFLLFFSSQAFLGQAQEASSEFLDLNKSRDSRAPLIKDAISQDLIYENENGYLSVNDHSEQSSIVINLVKIENKDRKKQFSIIAKSNKMTISKVGRQFAEKHGFNRFASAETSLRIHGSNTIGDSLMAALVADFLEKKKLASDIKIQKKNSETRVFYHLPDQGNQYLSVDIVAHGSYTAFQETASYKHVGLAGKFCDIGMSSRSIKNSEVRILKKLGLGDLQSPTSAFPIAVGGICIIVSQKNPIQALTIPQITGLFSGEITNWRELGGSNQEVTLYSSYEHSGNYYSFDKQVMRANNMSLAIPSVNRFEENAEVAKKVGQTAGGIGIICLSAVDHSVHPIAIKANKGARAIFPNRLTVKSLDYPLSRLLYLYAPESRSELASDLLSYIMTDSGQRVVDKEGFVGQGLATKFDHDEFSKIKDEIIADKSLPKVYRETIADADRKDSGFNVRFPAASSLPDNNSINNLRRLANLLADPGMEEVKIVLIGFTDNQGSAARNVQLSENRAKAVAQFLAENGVTQVTSIGLGEIMPISDNNSEKGRAANRRVEVWLKR